MIIRLLRRCHLPLLALLSASPLLALTACNLAPQAAKELSCFPLVLLPALFLCAGASGRIRGMAFCVCVASFFGAGRLLLPPDAMSLAMPALCAALLAFSLAYASKKPAQVSPMFYLVCILAQAAALFFLYHADDAVRAILHMRSAFFLWLLLFALAFNRISLNNATQARYRLSMGMARTGTALTFCVFLLALVLCAMPIVVSGVIFLFGTMRDAGVWFLLFFINLIPSASTVGSSSPDAPMFPGMIAEVQREPSIVTLVLEKMAAVLALIVLIAGCAVLLRLAMLSLVQLARRVLMHLQRYAAAVTEDYEDEISDTRGESGEHTFLPLRRSAKAKRTYPDTPVGRIRRRYAQLRSRNPAWTDSSTARENLSCTAAELYERARYSQHAPTQQDALQFEKEIQQTRKESQK